MVQVTLQAANGQYVCAEGGGSQSLAANKGAVGEWEKFTLIERGNGVIALQAVNRCYVTAVGGGGGELHSRVKIIDIWESFKLIDRGNGKVALQCHNGQYICAEGGGGQKLVANRNAIGPWETFTLNRLEVASDAERKDLYYSLSSKSFGGSGGTPFEDPLDVVSRGSITKVVIRCADEIDSIRLIYGQDGYGSKYGGDGGREMTWDVPPDHQIVRVEGRAAKRLDQLQFFTDKGASSPVFGGNGGSPFVYPELPNSGFLRTISGRAGRKIDKITLQFGAPYYIKEIIYDEQALDDIRQNTKPKQIFTATLPNSTSLQQQMTYAYKDSKSNRRTLTFQQSLGLKLGASLSVKSPLGEVAGEASATFTAEVSVSATFTQQYENTKTEEVSWSVPVQVPPKKKIVATSVIREAKVSIPFTYVVAWYERTKSNIKKEVRLPGVYEGVHLWDLQHNYVESDL